MSTPSHEVFFCQEKICKGESCKYFDGRCNHKMYRPDKPEPKNRTCPECGYVNPREAIICERCDYPLQF